MRNHHAVVALEPQNVSQKHFTWHDPRIKPFRILGFPWLAEEGIYRRLPRNPQEPISKAVDGLADHSAGGQIHFRSDSRLCAVRVRLAGGGDMHHMPETGQCSFDCYIGESGSQHHRWTAMYDHGLAQYESVLFEINNKEMRTITLNFPLYQKVESVEVGLDEGAQILTSHTCSGKKPVIVYGTSIVQGACASRPGMAYTNILSRKLDREVINLGFSASGDGSPAVARLMASIPNPASLVLDYNPNRRGEDLRRTFPPFVNILRKEHPFVPILAISAIPNSWDAVEPAPDRIEDSAFIRDEVDKRKAAGDERIHFLDGTDFLGPDFNECFTDGCHPSDLGFMRMGENLAGVLSRFAMDT